MPLTLGSTGMDAATEAALRSAFEQANAGAGGHWQWIGGDNADYVVVDMDSLYGPMSWLQLHAAGRRVIGLTGNSRSQTDYRLPSPVSAEDLGLLLSEIAGQSRLEATTPAPATAAPSGPTPAPAPTDILPPPQAIAPDEEQLAMPTAEETQVAAPPASQPVEVPATITTATVAPQVEPEREPAPEPEAPRERRLGDWLRPGQLAHRVRLTHADQVLLIDPQARTYHASPALKPLAPLFEAVLELSLIHI